MAHAQFGRLGCILLLVTKCLSLCVQEDGTNSTCTNSSLLLVSRTQLKENGYSLIVNELPNISTNCTTIDKEISASIRGSNLQLDYLDKDKTSVKIKVPDFDSGRQAISISYSIDDSNFCNMKAVLNHEITLKIIDKPHVIHQSNDPHTLKCLSYSQDADVWIEFVLNNKILGYCGQFTSPVEHKDGISINYDSSMEACILMIDKLTKENEGNYSCSVMVPYPDGNGFLKISSTSLTLHTPTFDATQTIGTAVGVTVGVIAIIVIVVAIIIMCKKKEWYKKLQWYREEEKNQSTRMDFQSHYR